MGRPRRLRTSPATPHSPARRLPYSRRGRPAPARQYTILQSAGLNGTTFSALAAQNLPSGFNASLGYTADNVLLNINATLGAGAGLNNNQQSVANTLNNFYNNGGTLPTNFASVFGLSGLTLANALSQLSGEVAADAEHGAFQMMTEFLSLMLDPFVDGRLGGGNGQQAHGFRARRASLACRRTSRWPTRRSCARRRRSRHFDQRWTAWGAAYGGGNTHQRQCDRQARAMSPRSTFGFAGGMDYHCHAEHDRGLCARRRRHRVGDWPTRLGAGRSDAFQAGVYGITRAGPAYLAGALAFTNHWFTTNRSGARAIS